MTQLPPVVPSQFIQVRDRIDRLPFSRIREVVRVGMGLSDLIPFWFGEPDQPTPSFIREAAKAGLDAEDTFYQANSGSPELRQALTEYMNGLYGTDLAPENITVSASAMNALMLATQVVAEPGRRMVLLAPTWPNLDGIQSILGAEICHVPLRIREGRWHLDLDELLDACDGQTSGILINSPGNPSGWMMSAEQQRTVLEFARKRGLWIVADEVYARIVYDRKAAPSFCELMTDEDRVIVVNSFSKSWAMTGWRLGWITASRQLERTFEMLTEYNIAGPPGFVQQAGVVALHEGEPFIRKSLERYRASRDLLIERLSAWPGVTLPTPEAAFYGFFQVEGLTDSITLAKDLLRTASVGLAPGSAFGDHYDDCLRLCFAVDPALLAEGLDRLEPVLARR